MNLSKLKDYNINDTIAAIATFPSKAALGVIKISGNKAFDIAFRIFMPRNKKDIRKAKTYTLHYGWIADGQKTEVRGQKSEVRTRDTQHATRNTEYIIDEVLLAIMRKPHSYTCQDVVEISSHGGVLVLNKILERVLKAGARLAQPGEFTYRALVNGRIDLLQAEGILDIVEAKSEDALWIATRQLRGEISHMIKALREEIKDLYAQTEAAINFPEDEVDISLFPLQRRVKGILKKVEALLAASEEAKILKEGLCCVICGKTNVGKSTLFNRLLREERVIVSHIPGTTRDVIEETINIRGIPLRIYDTAGILEPKDLVEKMATEKSSCALLKADLVILMFDGSRPFTADDAFLLEKVRGKKTIFLVNKIDLPQRLKVDLAKSNDAPIVRLSLLKEKGLKSLEEAISKSVSKEGASRADMIFLNTYQKIVLSNIQESLKQSLKFLENGYPIDFLNTTLKDCLDNIGRLSGEVSSEEILENIFSKFCIGK